MLKLSNSLIFTVLLIISVNAFSYGSTPPEKPTTVYTTAFIADIQNLDEVNEQIQIDTIFKFKWHDPRLAFDSKKEDTEYKNYNVPRKRY